jgi:hypothetical protein
VFKSDDKRTYFVSNDPGVQQTICAKFESVACSTLSSVTHLPQHSCCCIPSASPICDAKTFVGAAQVCAIRGACERGFVDSSAALRASALAMATIPPPEYSAPGAISLDVPMLLSKTSLDGHEQLELYKTLSAAYTSPSAQSALSQRIDSITETIASIKRSFGIVKDNLGSLDSTSAGTYFLRNEKYRALCIDWSEYAEVRLLRLLANRPWLIRFRSY